MRYILAKVNLTNAYDMGRNIKWHRNVKQNYKTFLHEALTDPRTAERYEIKARKQALRDMHAQNIAQTLSPVLAFAKTALGTAFVRAHIFTVKYCSKSNKKACEALEQSYKIHTKAVKARAKSIKKAKQK